MFRESLALTIIVLFLIFAMAPERFGKNAGEMSTSFMRGFNQTYQP